MTKIQNSASPESASQNMAHSADQTAQFDALEQMFNASRGSEPEFLDENFTKVVMNSVDSQVRRRRARASGNRSVSFDMLGLLLGLACVYLYIDIPAVLSFALGYIPSSIVISPLVVLLGVLAIACLSLAAWWVVEEESHT